MRRLLSLIITLFVATSCSIDEPDVFVSGDRGVQTTLVYFAGTSLSSYYSSNIRNMKTAVADGALGGSGVLFYLLPSSSGSATLYELVASNGECVATEMKSYSDFASLEQASVQMVIEDFKELSGYNDEVEYEREINLVVGSHGYGWRLKDYTRSIFGCEFDEYQEIPTRYLGNSSDGYLDIDEFVAAIELSDTRFSYVIFDACLMSSVEVLYRMRDCCDYIVASPSEVMAAGFPYNTVIPELFEQNGTTYDLQGVCEAYYDYYMYDYSSIYKCGSVSMCITSELDELADIVSQMSLESVDEDDIQVYDGNPLFYDLGQYINVAGANDPMLDSFNAQFDVAFPESYRLTTGYFYTNVGSTRGETAITYYSGVSTSEIGNSSYRLGWELEPWAIDAGRVSD